MNIKEVNLRRAITKLRISAHKLLEKLIYTATTISTPDTMCSLSR